MGNPDKEKYDKSLKAFIDELQRVEQLGLTLLNFHPGGHLNKMTEAECISQVAESINIALKETENAVAVNTAYSGNTQC